MFCPAFQSRLESRFFVVALSTGIRAIVVPVKDDAVRAFYERLRFLVSPTDPLHLFILTKDLRRIIGGGAE